jgi:hypothetical protein
VLEIQRHKAEVQEHDLTMFCVSSTKPTAGKKEYKTVWNGYIPCEY